MLGDWLIIGVLYVLALGFFRVLGGWNGAGEAFRRWGKASAEPRNDRLSPSSS